MRVRRLFQALVFSTVLMLVISACGQAAAPTATVPATATPSAVKTVAPAPAPTTSSAPAAIVPAVSGYSPERVKEMLAQNMYLATMQYGKGETPQYGGTAVHSNKADPQTDDPMLTGSITVRNVFGAVTGDGGLLRYKRTQNDVFDPYLAESWTVSDDYKTWTFKLRPNVKWHDGTTMVADDIKWYIDVAVFPPKGRKVAPFSNAAPGLKEVKVVDSLTLQLIFKDASPQLLEELSSYSYTIAHQRKLGQAEIEKGNVGFGMAVLGGVSVGPFKWDKYVKGASFHAVRFDQYWEKDEAGRSMPYLDAISNALITDKTVTLGAFRAGRLDTMSRGIGASPDAEMMQLIQRSLPGKVWYHRYPYLNNGLSFNATKPPFDDVRLRRAVALYIDRDEACQKMYGGFCYGSGWTVPGVSWYSGEYVNFPGFNQKTKAQDQAEAKRIVKELGLVGTKVEQSCRIDYTFNAEFNEQVLRSLGFEPRINCMDIQLNSEYNNAGKMMTSTGGAASGGFPSPVMAGLVSTAVDIGTVLPAHPEFDRWQKIVLTSLDPKERRDALWAAEKFYFEEKVFAAPYFREEVIMPQRTYLKGTIVPGWAAHANEDRATDWIDKSSR